MACEAKAEVDGVTDGVRSIFRLSAPGSEEDADPEQVSRSLEPEKNTYFRLTSRAYPVIFAKAT